MKFTMVNTSMIAVISVMIYNQPIDGKSLRGAMSDTDRSTGSSLESSYPTSLPTSTPTQNSTSFIIENTTSSQPLISLEVVNELVAMFPNSTSNIHHRKLDGVDGVKFPAGGNVPLPGNGFSIGNSDLGTSPFEDIQPCDDSNGYDTRPCTEFVETNSPSYSESTTIKDASSRNAFIKSSVNAEGGSLGVHVSVSAKFMESKATTTSSISYMLGGSINKNIKRIRNPSQLKLTPYAKDLLVNHTSQFISTWGLNFVHSIGYGGNFVGGFTLNTETSQQQSDIDVKTKLSYKGGIYSASGSAQFEEDVSSSSFQMKIDRSYQALPEPDASRSSINSPIDLKYVYGNWSKTVNLDNQPSPVYFQVITYAASYDIQQYLPEEHPNIFKESAISPVTIQRATNERINTNILINSIESIKNWPKFSNQTTPTMYKALADLETKASSYNVLYTSNFTDVSLYQLQNQLLTGKRPNNEFGSWLYYSEVGGLKDQFDQLRPQFEVSYVQNFDGKTGIQCCRDNGFHGLGNGQARTPSDCQNACNEDEQNCQFFDHSMKWQNCIFCTSCEPVTENNAKYYTSWSKEEKFTNANNDVVLLNPPTEPEYQVEYMGGQCCRHNSMNIPFGKASSPFDCQRGCDGSDSCRYFDHSDKFQNCIFCEACDHRNKDHDADDYTSWKKVV